jgi:hypothetical protein
MHSFCYLYGVADRKSGHSPRYGYSVHVRQFRGNTPAQEEARSSESSEIRITFRIDRDTLPFRVTGT